MFARLLLCFVGLVLLGWFWFGLFVWRVGRSVCWFVVSWLVGLLFCCFFICCFVLLLLVCVFVFWLLTRWLELIGLMDLTDWLAG